MTTQPNNSAPPDDSYPATWKPAHVRRAEKQAHVNATEAPTDDNYPSHFLTKGIDNL